MSLPAIVITCAAIGAMIPGYIALLVWMEPVRGLAQATHRAEQLPLVMVDRYAAFALFALAASLSGDMTVVAVTFAILAVPGFGDAAIYARAGHSWGKHFAAGIAAAGVALLACIALLGGPS